jgi:catechol 2,3-dioxygenase-like lactoylglutathione lyase family enzyme
MVMKLSSPGIDLGIVVSDLDRSLHFYRGLLGLHHEGSNPVPGGGTMHRLWAAESMIKLVAPESAPDQPVIAGGLRAGALGLRYFTFSVADLDELMSDLKANDVPVIRDVTEMGPGVRIAIVEDPDGNHVEFLERL